MEVSHNNLPEAVSLLLSRIDQLEQKINTLSESPGTESPEILNVAQAAEFLGLQLNTLRIKASRKELAYIKRNGRLYFNRADLVAYLQAGRQPAKDEIYQNPTKYLGTPKRRANTPKK